MKVVKDFTKGVICGLVFVVLTLLLFMILLYVDGMVVSYKVGFSAFVMSLIISFKVGILNVLLEWE